MICSACREVEILRKVNRQLWVLVITLVVLLFLTNVSWLIYESQFEIIETMEITADAADGGNAIIASEGGVVFGDGENQKDGGQAPQGRGEENQDQEVRFHPK